MTVLPFCLSKLCPLVIFKAEYIYVKIVLCSKIYKDCAEQTQRGSMPNVPLNNEKTEASQPSTVETGSKNIHSLKLH